MNKKLLVVLSLILILACACPAIAKTRTEEVNDYAKTFNNVKNALSLIIGNDCYVALHLEKITQKTIFDKKTEEIRNAIAQKFGFDNVFITSSPKVFHYVNKINNTIDENERQQLIEKLIEKISRQPKTLPFER